MALGLLVVSDVVLVNAWTLEPILGELGSEPAMHRDRPP